MHEILNEKTIVDFTRIKHETNGMLSSKVYQSIYETARRVKNGDAVEIGTAHGAASIAIAYGLPSGSVLHTVDKIKGGSRDNFGNLETNNQIINENFQRFGVADRIKFHIGHSKDIAPELAKMEIGLLMLDADGAIDREIKLFYNNLLPNALIIIDDYQPDFVRVYKHGKNIKIDQKRRLTAMLVDYFVAQGFLSPHALVEQTWFGTKPANAPLITEIINDDIYDIYRKLTFASGTVHSSFAEIINAVTRKFPALHQTLKNTYVKYKT